MHNKLNSLNSKRNIKTKFKNLYHKIKKNKQPPPSLPYLINAGILYICAGKYEKFFKSFYTSFSENFLPGAVKKFFVFTDSKTLKTLYENHQDIVFIPVEKREWPYNSLLRNHYFFEHFEKFNGMNYLFFSNANMICNEKVYLNETGLAGGYGLCGALHPFHFYNKPDVFPLERKLQCHAHFSDAELTPGLRYYQGCFYGGTFENFFEMVDTIYKWTTDDLAQNKIPIWIDESYLNKYFVTHEPFKLHPGFAYPGNAIIPFPKKIINIDKTKHGGHDFLRN